MAAVSFVGTVVSLAILQPATAEEIFENSAGVAYAADLVRSHTGLSAGDLIAREAVADELGQIHVRFDRTYRGLAVNGGDIVLHMTNDGRYRGVSGLRPVIRVGVKPAIDGRHASAIATTRSDGHGDVLSRLDIYVDDDGKRAVLVWHVTLSGAHDGRPFVHEYFIDARSGRIVEEYDNLETADAIGTGNSFFNRTVSLHTNSISGGYNLKDITRGGQYSTDMNNGTSGRGAMFSDVDNNWGDGRLSNRQTVGVDAQYGAAMTWDYYLAVHNRRGIAGDGRGAFNRVHYGSSYDNAFWSDSCFCMTFGDGDGKTFNPFNSLDVVGHEMSHGVTSRTAKLVYRGEAGGLNEGTSDIFGAMVEYFADNPNDSPDYLIGERLYKTPGKFLRNMADPRADGLSIDNYRLYYNGLDVHYSSGIANNFFCLLAEGGTNRTSGISVPAGIGRPAAEKIWYRALTTYMTSRTKFRGARTACLNAAADLYGTTSTQYKTVLAAWTAVGVK